VSSLIVTIPVTLLLAGLLLGLVVRAARRGDYDDWEGPAARALLDDDATPELETPSGDLPASAASHRQGV
jgi:cbb3-type cytochrome oxidase maturation protein